MLEKTPSYPINYEKIIFLSHAREIDFPAENFSETLWNGVIPNKKMGIAIGKLCPKSTKYVPCPQ